MVREIVLLAIGAIFGLGATMTGAVAPQYLNLNATTAHWLFWGGISLMALMVVDGAVLLLAGRVINFGPAVLGNVCLAGVMIAAVWQTSLPSLATRIARLDTEADNLRPIIESLRRNQNALAQQEYTSSLVATILASFDHLRKGIEAQERFSGKADLNNRLAAAEHTIGELKNILRDVRTLNLPQGQALIIKTAPNTFRITFPVPMRVPPNVICQAPAGLTMNQLEKTNIGVTLIFTPATIPLDVLPPCTFSAEL